MFLVAGLSPSLGGPDSIPDAPTDAGRVVLDTPLVAGYLSIPMHIPGSRVTVPGMGF